MTHQIALPHSSNPATPKLRRRLFGRPRTMWGTLSLWCLVGLLAVAAAWVGMLFPVLWLVLTLESGPGFWAVIVFGFFLYGAGAILGVAALALAAFAVVRGDWSFVLIVPVLLGAYVLVTALVNM